MSAIDPDLRFFLDCEAASLLPIAAVVEFEPVDGEPFGGRTEAEQLALIDRSRRALASEVLRLGRHRVASFVRPSSPPPPYRDLVARVAQVLKVPATGGGSVVAAERAVVEGVLESLRKSLSEAEWEQLLQEAMKAMPANAAGKTVALGAGALTAANLAGFSLYLAATTGLAAIAGVVGIVLPFAVYTTLSSAIALVVGPAGWVTVGLAGLYQLGKPSQKRMLAVVLAVAAARALGLETPDVTD